MVLSQTSCPAFYCQLNEPTSGPASPFRIKACNEGRRFSMFFSGLWLIMAGRFNIVALLNSFSVQILFRNILVSVWFPFARRTDTRKTNNDHLTGGSRDPRGAAPHARGSLVSVTSVLR
ncbi:hypothetical protein ATANTOWER_011444 [Ataeniobius toweri]|uniref:Uncharacterized protein n=1 Tax=Ataeniobius toweri TaxID=208326 RepID=A0ABU7AZV4_9TELE|nr:hypothetical protein [Ataeniobius toweri]